MNPSSEGDLQSIDHAWSRLSFAAWLSLTVHIIAGLGMATILSQGLATNTDLADRLSFIADRKALWIGAWLAWSAAALAIFYFYMCFAHAHELGEKSPKVPLRFAVLLTAAAIAADLSAQAIQMGVIPQLAIRAVSEGTTTLIGTSTQLFHTVDRIAILLTGYLANGLYTISALLLVASTWHVYPRWTWTAGVAVGVAGLSLSTTALANSVTGMVWSNVVLVPAIVVWQFGVAVAAGKRARRLYMSLRS